MEYLVFQLLLYSFFYHILDYITTKLSNSMKTHKQGTKNLSISLFSLFLCKLEVCKMFVRNQNLNRKVVFIALI